MHYITLILLVITMYIWWGWARKFQDDTPLCSKRNYRLPLAINTTYKFAGELIDYFIYVGKIRVGPPHASCHHKFGLIIRSWASVRLISLNMDTNLKRCFFMLSHYFPGPPRPHSFVHGSHNAPLIIWLSLIKQRWCRVVRAGPKISRVAVWMTQNVFEWVSVARVELESYRRQPNTNREAHESHTSPPAFDPIYFLFTPYDIIICCLWEVGRKYMHCLQESASHVIENGELYWFLGGFWW